MGQVFSKHIHFRVRWCKLVDMIRYIPRLMLDDSKPVTINFHNITSETKYVTRTEENFRNKGRINNYPVDDTEFPGLPGIYNEENRKKILSLSFWRTWKYEAPSIIFFYNQIFFIEP